MKISFTAMFAVLAAATVCAERADTNAYRMARGLPPNPPALRGPGILGAKRGTPSNSPVCLPILQACTLDSDCCADLCLAGLCL
ncbi:hypothetical protein B0H12DRAFT_1237954 [Mycena haematopus]|nr:hypothetical protein B0H12DRAFT_1237954 [Mycena haematopus]